MPARLWVLFARLSMPLILPVGHSPQGSLLRVNPLKVSSLHIDGLRLSSPHIVGWMNAKMDARENG